MSKDKRNAFSAAEVGGQYQAKIHSTHMTKSAVLFAKSHEEMRGEDWAGAWERTKEGEVGMGRGQWRHGVVKVLDRLQGGTELGHKGTDKADGG